MSIEAMKAPLVEESQMQQICRLACANGQMRYLIAEAITAMSHADIFISSREKMHPTGVGLWGELIERLQQCLDDQNKRCSGCGGSLPVTGKLDTTGECTCQEPI